MSEHDDLRELFDLSDAARYLRLHPNTLRRACLSGQIRHRTGLDDRIWIFKRDLVRFAPTLRRRDRGLEEQSAQRPAAQFSSLPMRA